jgi:hypothetical protein
MSDEKRIAAVAEHPGRWEPGAASVPSLFALGHVLCWCPSRLDRRAAIARLMLTLTADGASPQHPPHSSIARRFH